MFMLKVIFIKKPLRIVFVACCLMLSVQSYSQLTNPFTDKLGPVKMNAGFAMQDYWVWCGSVIKGEDGVYHMFASRWSKENPFHPSWMLFSEVVRAESKNVEGPYEFKEVVLPARGAQYWDGRATHNPSITKVGDEYVLFYMGSTHPFADPNSPDQIALSSHYATVGRANKRIGVATSKSLKGPWIRKESPVIPIKPNTFYSFLTSNPAPLIRKDGSVLVVFKGRRYGDKFPFQSAQKIGIAYAKSIHDPFVVLNDDMPLTFGNTNSEFEDPFLWEDEKGLHLLMKDMGSRVTGEHHAGVLFHSQNGIDWTLDAQPKAYSRTLKFDDGSGRKMGQLERPFVYFENGKPICMFFATMDGPGGFDKGTRSWNIAVPISQ